MTSSQIPSTDILTYDPNSNITRKGTDTYIYDGLNQIIQAKYTDKRYGTMEGNSYAYDLMGNRTDTHNLRWVTKTNKKAGTTTEIEKRKVWGYRVNTLNQYTDILAQSGTISTPVNTGSTNTGSTSTGTTNTGATSTGTTQTGTLINTGSLENGTGTTSTGGINTGFLISDTGSTDLAGRLLYDKNGNLIGNILNNKREYEYTYDGQNRLITVSRYNTTNQKEVLISFQYDALGKRITKRVQNQLIEYTYSDNDVIESERFTRYEEKIFRLVRELLREKTSRI